MKVTYSALLFLALSASATASAQRVLGPGENAVVLPPGVLRVRVLGSWMRSYERYGLGTPGRADGAVEPLATDFNLDTVGVSQFENLAPLQTEIRTLTGMPGFAASLGRSVMQLRDSRLTTPVAAEVGLTRRISIGVLVPFVTAIANVDFRFNPSGREPTLGFNPTLLTTAAIDANAALLTQFDSAAAQLGRTLSACASTPDAPGCAAVNANAADARGLIANASAFAAGIAEVYGGREGSRGSPFVPISGTVAQSAIEARVAAFRSLYAAYGTTAINGTGPRAAQTPFTAADFQRMLADSALGIRARPLATTVTRGIGDVDFAVRVNLFDSFRRDPNAMRSPSGFRWRQSIGGVYRLGAGTLHSPENLIDRGTGDGQNDVELASFTDVLLGSRFWMSLVARFNVQLADEQTLRITAAPAQVFAAAYRQQTVRRNLGDVLDLEFLPRLVLTDYVAFAGSYSYRRKFGDRHAGIFSAANLLGQAVALDASALDAETEAREHRFGGGISYSSVAAYGRGKVRVPLEISYSHFQSTRGSGGNVPKLTQDEVELRLYARLFGR